jgi:hypothetical protein
MTSMSDEDLKVDRQPHLMNQDASKVDPTKLTALTPEVVSICQLGTSEQCDALLERNTYSCVTKLKKKTRNRMYPMPAS